MQDYECRIESQVRIAVLADELNVTGAWTVAEIREVTSREKGRAPATPWFPRLHASPASGAAASTVNYVAEQAGKVISGK